MNREEARGGERDARAGKLFVDMELGGNIGRGREGVPEPSVDGNVAHNP